jgi:hypothetical protein
MDSTHLTTVVETLPASSATDMIIEPIPASSGIEGEFEQLNYGE